MMAFFSTRFSTDDENSKRRHSVHSFVSTPELNSYSSNQFSCRNCDMTSIKYINSAASNDTTPVKSDYSDSYRDVKMSKYQSMLDTQSGIVPPLNLQFEDSNLDLNLSYQGDCHAAKSVLKPDLAYETWLSAKKKLISDKVNLRKKAEEQKRTEQEKRKRMAEEKYQQWLAAKLRTQSEAKKTSEQKPKPQSTGKTDHEKIAKWERAKQLEIERRRIEQQKIKEILLQKEEERRKMAADAWEKWLQDADKKPKPVPLNRGMFTLRGTISNIFVNPNEWKYTTKPNEE